MNKNIVLTKEPKDLSFTVDKKLKIAHNRLDHDGYRWWNKWFPAKGTSDKNVIKEMEDISDYMTNKLKKGISSIYELIGEMDLIPLDSNQKEYNVFYEGEFIDCWIRLITRRGDYNMYIHCYEKKENVC